MRHIFNTHIFKRDYYIFWGKYLNELMILCLFSEVWIQNVACFHSQNKNDSCNISISILKLANSFQPLHVISILTSLCVQRSFTTKFIFAQSIQIVYFLSKPKNIYRSAAKFKAQTFTPAFSNIDFKLMKFSFYIILKVW